MKISRFFSSCSFLRAGPGPEGRRRRSRGASPHPGDGSVAGYPLGSFLGLTRRVAWTAAVFLSFFFLQNARCSGSWREKASACRTMAFGLFRSGFTASARPHLASAHLEAIDSLRKAVRASPGEVYERSEQRPNQKQNV